MALYLFFVYICLQVWHFTYCLYIFVYSYGTLLIVCIYLFTGNALYLLFVYICLQVWCFTYCLYIFVYRYGALLIVCIYLFTGMTLIVCIYLFTGNVFYLFFVYICLQVWRFTYCLYIFVYRYGALLIVCIYLFTGMTMLRLHTTLAVLIVIFSKFRFVLNGNI